MHTSLIPHGSRSKMLEYIKLEMSGIVGTHTQMLTESFLNNDMNTYYFGPDWNMFGEEFRDDVKKAEIGTTCLTRRFLRSTHHLFCTYFFKITLFTLNKVDVLFVFSHVCS